MRRPRSIRLPPGQAGIWHLTSRCVRRQHLLDLGDGKAWMATRLAAWLDLLAIDLLGYALMGNHVHLVVRTRPDLAQAWSTDELRDRWHRARQVRDGVPGPAAAAQDARLPVGSPARIRAALAHPGAMLRAVKEAFARRINRDQQAAGHVWEGRYHDVALIDAGGVLACLVYVDLNPFRAGLAQDPAASAFCSARHRRSVDAQAPDAPLGQRLCAIAGHPLLDADGQELGSWSWNAADVADLAAATARLIRDGQGRLPDWAEELLPRLGIARARWGACMAAGGMITGNVLGNQTSRRIHAGTGRLPSDKSQLFAND